MNKTKLIEINNHGKGFIMGALYEGEYRTDPKDEKKVLIDKMTEYDWEGNGECPEIAKEILTDWSYECFETAKGLKFISSKEEFDKLRNTLYNYDYIYASSEDREAM